MICQVLLYNQTMSKQPMSEWDQMVCEKLAETDRQIANGTFKTISREKADRMMDARLKELRQIRELRQKEIKEHQR